MITEPKVSLFDLVMSLSEAMDLVHPALFNHHMRVAYISMSIANELHIEPENQAELVMAGMLHDCGSVYLNDRLSLVDPSGGAAIGKLQKHSEAGYSLLNQFEPFSAIANLVRMQSVHWDKENKQGFMRVEIPVESSILHFADRAAVLMTREEDLLSSGKNMREKITALWAKDFSPELIDAFVALAGKEYFWLDIKSPAMSAVLARRVRFRTIELNLEALVNLTKIFSQIIDFRSKFTATHSSGVAAVAESIARQIGYSDTECKMIRVAGYLHDLGKLAVPAEILEKPSELTEDEFAVIKRHPYYTHRILERVPSLDAINTWASFHHEYLDGSGYPFHLKESSLSFESRIMAIAEFFTAATEDLPYREGLSGEVAVKLIRQKALEGKLDPQITEILSENFKEINHKRVIAEEGATEEYQKFAA